MNNGDREYFDEKFEKMDERIKVVHDDVLVLKTRWDMTLKFVGVVSGFIALITSIVVKFIWR